MKFPDLEMGRLCDEVSRRRDGEIVLDYPCGPCLVTWALNSRELSLAQGRREISHKRSSERLKT